MGPGIPAAKGCHTDLKSQAQQVRFFCEKFGLYLSHPPLHARRGEPRVRLVELFTEIIEESTAWKSCQEWFETWYSHSSLLVFVATSGLKAKGWTGSFVRPWSGDENVESVFLALKILKQVAYSRRTDI